MMDHSAKPIFNFVNLSHPNELKDADTQLRIRRLAMSEVGRSRRKPRTRREKNEIRLEIRPPPEGRPAIGQPISGDIEAFGPFPIELDDNSQSLVRSIFRDGSAHSRQLRGCWYPIGLSEKAAFYNILSNAHLYRLKEHTGAFPRQDDASNLSQQNIALRLLREKMDDSSKHDSDELLSAIVLFMYHHYILGYFEGWEHHRNAMSRVIQLKGGVDKIKREDLRIIISWCDLIGAFAQDIPSIISLPHNWTIVRPLKHPDTPSLISSTWKRKLPTKKEWISIFDEISQILSSGGGFTDEDLERATTTGSWIEPLMVRLLDIRPLDRGTTSENVIEQVCRLGSMLFLAPIWRFFGFSPVWTFNISRNLLTTLLNYTVEWHELKPLLVWSLYFAAIETKDFQERSQYAFMLALLMDGLGLGDWEGLVQTVKSVLWAEKVFVGGNESLRNEVLSILQMPTGSAMPVMEEG